MAPLNAGISNRITPFPALTGLQLARGRTHRSTASFYFLMGSTCYLRQTMGSAGCGTLRVAGLPLKCLDTATASGDH